MEFYAVLGMHRLQDIVFHFIPIRMEEEGEEITYILQIKPESKGVKLKVTDDLAKFTVMIKCSAQITDASKAKSVEDITRSQIVQKKA